MYVTSYRLNASGNMASDVIREFAKQIACVDVKHRDVDLLIVSLGGDPTVSWRVISMLRDRFEKVSVLLPFAAYSAATLIALGADEIVMHPFSNLGPVDPQLRSRRRSPDKKETQEQTAFASEDLRNFIDFVRNDVGISDQAQMSRAFEMICDDVGAIPIGMAKRSSQLALMMGEKLLSIHMNDHSKAKAIAETLNKSFYHHGYPLDRKEAVQIGLPVVEPDPNLEDLMWKVWIDIEEEMQCAKPFDPAATVLSDPASSQLLAPVPQVQIPANLPPSVAQNAYNNILSQIKIVQVPPVDYDLFMATLESLRCRSEYRTKGKILAVRLPDMSIATNTIKLNMEWTFYTNVDSEEG